MIQNIPIKNKELLDLLNEIKDFFVSDKISNNVYVDRSLTLKDKEWYTGEKYLNEIKAMGREHDGYPTKIKSHSITPNNLRFVKASVVCSEEIIQQYGKYVDKLAQILMLKHNALFAIYPPDGFISWHNNANASAYNFIFTYSETGDGYWKHWDPIKKEIVTIPDVPGWQCKAGYFGGYVDGEDKLVYHTAATNSCRRMTVAFVLDRSEMSQGIQEWVIEDIMSE